MAEQRVVIIGGGPAGMMLAYQLASNGVNVRVLERHPDFQREFRGELVQGSLVELLERAGIFPLLLQRGLALPNIERHMYLGKARRVQLPGPNEKGALISQPGFLSLLHELCSRYPSYRLDFSTPVLEAVEENGRVVAVQTRAGRVDGDLFVVCNGRNSPLRKSFGLKTESFETTADALWLRFDFSDAREALPSTVDVHMFGAGVVMVNHRSSNDRLHIAYSAPDDLNALKRDLPRLKERLGVTLKEPLRSLVEKKLNADTETQVLKIIVDRAKSWHAPGILFLGDAAHTMSPSGGQGLNVAIRDTFVAANRLVPVLRAGTPLEAAVLQSIQDERMPEIEAIQKRQTRAGQMVLKPLPVLHLMMTMLAGARLFMGKKLARGDDLTLPEPKFLTPVGAGARAA
jgi:2-polyprenyl-6-methoxyphenol hydroxylase-like FAD-dependent oxidoreductase